MLWTAAQKLAGATEGRVEESPTRLVVLYQDEQGREVADLIHEALIKHWQRLKDWLDGERSLFYCWVIYGPRIDGGEMENCRNDSCADAILKRRIVFVSGLRLYIPS